MMVYVLGLICAQKILRNQVHEKRITGMSSQKYLTLHVSVGSVCGVSFNFWMD